MSKEKQNTVSPVGLFEGCTGVKTEVNTEVSVHEPLPYLSFPWSGTNIWGKLKALVPGLVENAPALISRSGETLHSVEPLNPLRLFLLDGFQYWCDKSKDAVARNVVLSDPGFKSGKSEWILGNVLLLHNGGVHPATLKIRDAMAAGFRDLLKFLRDTANTEEWFARSPAHKFTTNIPYPCLQGVATVIAYKKPAKGGPNAGKPYDITKVDIAPTTPEEAKLVAEFLKSDEWKNDLEAKFRDNLNSRISEVKAAVAK